MATRSAEATWQGTLQNGTGSVKTSSGAFEGPYSFRSRFEDAPQTNPEELLGAAHAACYSMALNNAMFKDGLEPKRVYTQAHVSLEKVETGFRITNIHLITEAEVPGLDAARFQEYAEKTKETCIVSQALSAVPMTLETKLL